MQAQYEYRQINITELLLNTMNPRFTPVEHQREAIVEMVGDQKGKLVVLAEHIIKHGLNPLEWILVIPEGDKWIVQEGNRRITALKLVNEPGLVPDKYSAIKRKIKELSKIANKDIMNNIPCVIVDNLDDANEWIRLKHTGENAGAGIVNWDAKQSSRFKEKISSKGDPGMIFLDALYLYDDIPKDCKDNFKDIKKTNFDRLISDPNVRELLGIMKDGNNLFFIEEANKYLIIVLCDLAFNNISVKDIYYKEDRVIYMQKIQERANQDESVYEERPNDENLNKSTKLEDDEREKNDDSSSKTGYNDTSSQDRTSPNSSNKSYPINRKCLIPSQHKLSIGQPRILKIFNELRKIELDTFPNAAAVLFRVFIELSADHYIFKNNIPGVSVDSTLSKKIEELTKDLENRQIMNRHELRAARQMSSSPTQNQSIQTFHSFVHNMNRTPNSTDLKSAWDDLWPFIDSIWR